MVSPYFGEFPERSALTESERKELEGRIHPFNRGRWPTDEERAARLEEIRRQMKKMKRENPRLYQRLPLLHHLTED